MVAIERENKTLKGVLPKDYGRPTLDKTAVGGLIDLIANIGLGDKESRSKDILGRVYEYFLSEFASAEGKIRKTILEADLVDCMVALPGQLFYSTQIPACLWFLTRSKGNGKFRDRRGETLFIDARKLGVLIDRVHRDLPKEEVERIAGTYHAWRGDPDAGKYEDVPGFCKSAKTEEIAEHGYVLTPGRYVGAEAVEDDGELFEEKMARLTKDLNEQFAEGSKLEAAIRENLKALGFPT